MKTISNWFKKIFGHKPNKNSKLGWKRDLPDPRDHKFKIIQQVKLPLIVDMRDKCPPVYDQGQIGSCTANAMGGIFQFEQMRQEIPNFMPSRLFIYYNTRAIEGTINEDAGATLRNTMKSMVEFGVCPEKMWGYGRCFKRKPFNNCYVEGEKNQVLEYLRVTHSMYDIKFTLSEGYPVAFGMMLYESFMSDDVTRTGKVPMPILSQESSLGGHAVMLVGYNDTKREFIVRNSWGRSWGDHGYFYLPYEYVETPNLTADYWTIKLVEGPEPKTPKKKTRKKRTTKTE